VNIKKILIVFLLTMAGIAVFILFVLGYFWFELVFMPWYQEVFSPWLVNEIKIIFSHPENFCGFLFILWSFICLLVMVGMLIGAFVSWVKKTLER
jgi:hypothetical protein